MAGQHARLHGRTKTTVRRKEGVRHHKTPSNGRRGMSLEGKGQKPDTNILPSAIEFLEVDVVGPFDGGWEAEESVLGEIEEV
jgi:hypothetical protein